MIVRCGKPFFDVIYQWGALCRACQCTIDLYFFTFFGSTEHNLSHFVGLSFLEKVGIFPEWGGLRFGSAAAGFPHSTEK